MLVLFKQQCPTISLTLANNINKQFVKVSLEKTLPEFSIAKVTFFLILKVITDRFDQNIQKNKITGPKGKYKA